MVKTHQRKGSRSNSLVGSDFEDEIQRYLREHEHLEFTKKYGIQLGLRIKKEHSFDLGYVKGKREIIIECKSHKWTEGNNVPSAKMTVWNEAMYYFYLVKYGTEKRMIVLRDFSTKRKKTLGAYYIERYGHLIPDDVSFYEYDEFNKTMVLLKTSSRENK